MLAVVWWKKDKTEELITAPNYQIPENVDNQQNTNNNQEKQWPLGTLYDPFYDPNVTTTSEGKKHYRNEEYGFEFDFPADWEIRQPAFGNTKIVLFNLEILPPGSRKWPEPILIIVNQREWIDKLMNAKKERGDNIEDIQVDGINGKRFLSPHSGLPHISHYFQFNDYWIDIGGKTQYEDILNGILKTVKFTK